MNSPANGSSGRPAAGIAGGSSWWWLRGLCVILLLEAGAGVSSLFVESGPGSWYAGLDKVAWTPPPWVFSPVWITLYALMGISFTLQWREGFSGSTRRWACGLFFLQLALNYSYTPVQFGLQSLWGQAIVILGVWGAAIAWVVLLARVHRLAALLQVFYVLWVSYAATVAIGLWWLNR